MSKHLYVVFTNAAEGREAEFNDWYDNVHLPDLVAIPGVTAATRYEFAPTDPSAPQPPGRYLAIYEIEGDPATALANIKAAAKTMTISSAMKRGPIGTTY